MMQDLSFGILDIVENSIEAEARRVTIRIEERPSKDRMVFKISDDGRGMGAELLRRATSPFVTTKVTRRIGLGLAFLAQGAKAAGGRFHIRSTPGQGTMVRATFQLSHLDRPPLGDVAETMAVLIAGHPETDFCYTHVTDLGRYVFRSKDHRARPGESSAFGHSSMAGIKNEIRGGIARLRRRP